MAVGFHRRVLREGRVLVTTNLVIAEAYLGIRRALGHRAAIEYLRTMQPGPRLLRLYSDGELEAQAGGILNRYYDQEFSFVDAVSFAVMRQRGIPEAFTFDRHFLTAGFTLLPA